MQICSSIFPRSSANDTFFVSPPLPPLPGRDPDNDDRTEVAGLTSPSDASSRQDDDAAEEVLDQFQSWAALKAGACNRRHFNYHRMKK